MLNTQALSLVVLKLEDFCHYKPTAHMDIPGAWSIWTPGIWLAGLMKGTTKYCYIQNIEALGLVIFFYYVFPIVSLWELSVAMETTIWIQSAPKT